MVETGNLQREHPHTIDFRSIFLPLYDARTATSRLIAPRRPLPQIGHLAINIHCPLKKVFQYENLLCNELMLKQAHYDTHQALSSLWFLGHPLKQLSPEAITELCFRFTNRFPHSDKLNTVRGIAINVTDLDRPTLALLAGLKFNCIEISIDELTKNADLSVTKVRNVLTMLADYGNLKIICRIKYNANTSPEFLLELLNLVEPTGCQQITLVGRNRSDSGALTNEIEYQDQLLTVYRHFNNRNWSTCGNNVFFGPQHENTKLRNRQRLVFSPWGFHSRSLQTRLGVGLGALSVSGTTYELNTAVPESYNRFINIDRALTVTQFDPKPRNIDLMGLVQDLLCYHQLNHCDDQHAYLLKPTLDQGLLNQDGAHLRLTENGVVNLAEIVKLLVPQSEKAIYNECQS
jgi:coproporphyrinogen III oxidase-like Fe-S oxidoreductase